MPVADAGSSVPGSTAGGVDAEDSHVFDTETHRRIGGGWLDTDPFPRMVIAKLCLEPVRIHQDKHSKLNRLSKRKDIVINDVLSTNAPELVDAVPFYKIISGALETELDGRLWLLLTVEEMWEDALPPRYSTIEHHVLAFTLIIVTGALTHENLGSRSTKAPQSIFVSGHQSSE